MRDFLRWCLLVGLGILAVTGCSESRSTGETGGTSGRSGSGGMAGQGGMACPVQSCLPPAERCEAATPEPIERCFELAAPPAQVNACTGVESTVNPPRCSPTGVTSTYQVTLLQVAPDCNEGFNLDGCDGLVCAPRGPSSEGIEGVDNGFATIDGLEVINRFLLDALSGIRRGETGRCDDSRPIGVLDIAISIETNPAEGCANVAVLSSTRETSRVSVNLGEATDEGMRCASGALGSIPLQLDDAEVIIEGLAVRMTVSDAGISDGMLGVVLDADNAARLLETALPSLGEGASDLADSYLDTFIGPWCGESDCNALSATYRFGGVVVPAP